jgi:hypothetical protein
MRWLDDFVVRPSEIGQNYGWFDLVWNWFMLGCCAAVAIHFVLRLFGVVGPVFGSA